MQSSRIIHLLLNLIQSWMKRPVGSAVDIIKCTFSCLFAERWYWRHSYLKLSECIKVFSLWLKDTWSYGSNVMMHYSSGSVCECVCFRKQTKLLWHWPQMTAMQRERWSSASRYEATTQPGSWSLSWGHMLQNLAGNSISCLAITGG